MFDYTSPRIKYYSFLLTLGVVLCAFIFATNTYKMNQEDRNHDIAVVSAQKDCYPGLPYFISDKIASSTDSPENQNELHFLCVHSRREIKSVHVSTFHVKL